MSEWIKQPFLTFAFFDIFCQQFGLKKIYNDRIELNLFIQFLTIDSQSMFIFWFISAPSVLFSNHINFPIFLLSTVSISIFKTYIIYLTSRIWLGLSLFSHFLTFSHSLSKNGVKILLEMHCVTDYCLLIINCTPLFAYFSPHTRLSLFFLKKCSFRFQFRIHYCIWYNRPSDFCFIVINRIFLARFLRKCILLVLSALFQPHC